jgi:predicted lipid-binding transport protein (Tim44 family)
MTQHRIFSFGALAAIALSALLALAPPVEAKMGGSAGGGMGSRGSKTFSAPPSTTTAPRAAAPIERSVTPPPAGPSMAGPSINQGAPRPNMAPAAPGGFGRGLLGGLAGGLIGAGLFGMLTGHGFLGGVGGLASIIGLLLQVALIAVIARFAIGWFMNRNAAPAGAGPRGPQQGFGFGGAPLGGFGVGAGSAPKPQPVQTTPIQLAPQEFQAFERLLGETQDAYSREDTSALARVATPEMSGYLEEEIAHNRGRGVVNRISGVKLLQGDLSEAWREGGDEYASVAMRFSMIDVMEDRETHKLVSGDPNTPTQSTEVWTFRRAAGQGPEAWKLSAIQQTQ